MPLTAADLEVRVLIDYNNPAIVELQEKIKSEMSGIKDEKQEYYVAGLSDALGIIMDYLEKQLMVGEEYYIVMPDDDVSNKIIKMRLYKITQKRKIYYSFTANNTIHPTNDLTLSNQNSIKMRVFKTEEEAEKNKHIMIWRKELRTPFL